MRQGAVQSRLQITRPLDALAIGAECPRHRGVIASQRDADLMPFKTLVKRLPTSPETFVVQDYCQGPDVVARRSFDFHASQTERAISRDIDDGLIRMGQFRAHRSRRGPAHRAGAAETDEAVGEQRLVMMRDIGTGHAGIMQQNRITAIEAIGQIPTGAMGFIGTSSEVSRWFQESSHCFLSSLISSATIPFIPLRHPLSFCMPCWSSVCKNSFRSESITRSAA